MIDEKTEELLNLSFLNVLEFKVFHLVIEKMFVFKRYVCGEHDRAELRQVFYIYSRQKLVFQSLSFIVVYLVLHREV